MYCKGAIMHRHHGHRQGRRHQDGYFDFHGAHGHHPIYGRFRAFVHDGFHAGPGGGYDQDGHPENVLHAGWHFLERLYDRLSWHAMGNRAHREGGGRRNWGGWGGGFGGMGGDGDGDDFTRGRKLSSADLQLLLLALLADKPAHGYELIKAIESLSNGFYAPSPGMVYPALTFLEELGHLVVAQEGNRKSYSLSDAGREHLGQSKERVEAILSRLAHIGAKMDSMRRAYSREGGADFVEGGGWSPELIEAKHKLKHALFEHVDMSPAEQKRIAEILLQAAKAISGG